MSYFLVVKLLHVIDTLGMGGAEQLLVNLLPELVRQGHTVGVAVLRSPLDLGPVLEEQGVSVRVLPQHGKWNLVAGARHVASAARDAGAEVIHAHLMFPGIYAGLARMLGLTKAKTCITYHNLAYAPGCNKPGPGLWLRRMLNMITSRFGMDGRLAVSAAVAAHYADALRPGQIDVIPNPIRIPVLAARGQETLDQGGKATGLRVVLPGRLVHEKGHAVLIEAAALLLAQGDDVRLVFAGGGPLEAQLQHKAEEAGVSDRLTITGKLPHSELLTVVAAADIIAIPSLFEGFGMTAAEAMALAVPVIAARTGGLVDIVEDDVTGLLVTPGDAFALAAGIARLAKDDALRGSLARAGQASVEARYSVKSVAEQMEVFYRRLCQKPA